MIGSALADKPAVPEAAEPASSRVDSLLAASVARAGWTIVLVGLAVFALALAPRWATRDTYVTADEDNWMRRAGGFAWGVANGRPGRTYQNGHPGVLTMELAILGQGPGGAERFADPVTGNPRVVTAIPGFFEALVDARRAFALATAAGVAAITLVALRLWSAGPALVGGLLLALDPFYLAHSQLVHHDALLSACMTLAALCALARWRANGGRGWVVVGGVLSGLALLAKVPALYLALFVPVAALLGTSDLRRRMADLALWGVVSLATIVALWPSMWVSPASTIARMVEFTRETGGQPHEQGSFFLGQQVVDPGPLFYPIALALRLSPIVVLGLLALLLVAWRQRSALGAARWRTAGVLLAYTVGFVVLMTLGAKKFDRYVLPVFPAVDLLAGVGLWCAWQSLRFGRSSSPQRLGRNAVALAVLLLASAWPLASVSPHYLAYYNPLLGGGSAAVRLIPVGEGEGLKEAAEWLNAQPRAKELTVVAESFDALRANFVGGGVALRERVPPAADFVVLYGYRDQIGRAPQIAAEYAGQVPEHVVRLHGIDYVRIYRGPRGARS